MLIRSYVCCWNEGMKLMLRQQWICATLLQYSAHEYKYVQRRQYWMYIKCINKTEGGPLNLKWIFTSLFSPSHSCFMSKTYKHYSSDKQAKKYIKTWNMFQYGVKWERVSSKECCFSGYGTKNLCTERWKGSRKYKSY